MRQTCTMMAMMAAFTMVLGAAADADTLGYWRFEEASGAAVDSGTGGNNGALLGGAARSATVFPAAQLAASNTTSMSFSGADGDAVNMGTSPEVDASDFTLEAWVNIRTDGADSFPLLAGKLIGGNFLDRGFELQARPDGSEAGEAGTGMWQARFAIRFGGNQDQVFSDDLEFNTWYHLAGVREGTGADAVRLYVNGVLAGTAATSHTSLTSAQQFSIGGADTGGGVFGRALDGWIDEVRLSNVALTPAEFLLVPEPASMALLGSAVILFGIRRGRR